MEFTWPMIVICVLLISSIRLFDIIKNKKEWELHKELLNLLFIIYILCLFQVVTFEDPYRYEVGNNFTLFKEIMRYNIGSRLFFKNVLGNLLMFVPYGLFVSMHLKIDKKYQALLLVSFASICIETTQLAIGRVFDIDDIVLNICGGMIGFFIYHFGKKVGQALPNPFQSKLVKNGGTFLLLTLLLCYLWKVMSI